MKWILVGFYFVLLCVFIKKNQLFKTAFPDYAFLLVIFLLKFLCGLLVGWIYGSYYHSGDSFAYLHDINVLHKLLFEHPLQYLKIVSGIDANDPALHQVYNSLYVWFDGGYNTFYNDNQTLIRLNAPLRIFSFGYYEIHVLFMSFISLSGLMMIFRVASFYSQQKQKLIALAIFCVPSVLLWGSGLMKESLQLFSMGFVLWRFHLLNKKLTTKNIFLFIASLSVLFFTRNYILLLFIPGLIAWWIYSRYKNLNCTFLFIICYCIVFTIAFQLRNIFPQFDIAQLLYDKQIIYWKNAVYYHAHSLIDRVPFAPSAISVIKRSPEAFWLTLSQPYLWECKNPLYYFSALENILFMFLLVWMILKLDRITLKNNPVFAFSLCFCIFLFIIIGLTTPVVGSMVRYKVPGLLFLGLAIVIGRKERRKKNYKLKV